MICSTRSKACPNFFLLAGVECGIIGGSKFDYSSKPVLEALPVCFFFFFLQPHDSGNIHDGRKVRHKKKEIKSRKRSILRRTRNTATPPSLLYQKPCAWHGHREALLFWVKCVGEWPCVLLHSVLLLFLWSTMCSLTQRSKFSGWNRDCHPRLPQIL